VARNLDASLQAADARAALHYALSLGVKASYAVEKEALWRRAGVSLDRLRANTAALAEELHMDAGKACVYRVGASHSCVFGPSCHSFMAACDKPWLVGRKAHARRICRACMSREACS
jgi:hypothetical protein